MFDVLKKHTLTLVPVDACTLTCPRCCARPEKGWLRRHTMLRDETRLCLERAKQHGVNAIIFSGGEPGIWPPLKWAVDRAQQEGMKVRIFTNGYHIPASAYGSATDVRISDYGGINRDDVYRLKKTLGRRLRIKWVEHLDMPVEPVDGPVLCNGGVPTVVGGRLYGCCVQAMRNAGPSIDIEEDWNALADPTCQAICHRCLDNMTVRKTRVPRLRFLWCVPETTCGGWLHLPVPTRLVWRWIPIVGRIKRRLHYMRRPNTKGQKRR